MTTPAARIFGKVRTRPRIFDRVEGSVEAWLVDQAWLIRDKVVGHEDTRPKTQEVVLGPWAARLSTPLTGEQKAEDRYLAETTHTAVVAMDEAPHAKDRVRGRRARTGVTELYRITRVLDREAPWGGTFLWHLELSLTQEY